MIEEDWCNQQIRSYLEKLKKYPCKQFDLKIDKGLDLVQFNLLPVFFPQACRRKIAAVPPSDFALSGKLEIFRLPK